MDFIKRKGEYERGILSRKDLHLDPFKQFDFWLQEAEKEGLLEPYAMQVATAGKAGIPSLRTVLLRAFDNEGFLFFTNYDSKKGRELLEQPQSAALFLWKELERQVVIEGRSEKLESSLSDEYFKQRKRESQITAWASKQDRPIPSRDFLEEQYQITESNYRGKPITRPPFWGGFRLIPTRFEFWQGRKFRLHDRFEYRKEGKSWTISRLSP